MGNSVYARAETFKKTTPVIKKMIPEEPSYGSSQRRKFSSNLLQGNETRLAVQEYMRQKRFVNKLTLYDNEEKRVRKLSFLSFQGTPQDRGGYHSFCAAFDDEETGDRVDVDFILQERYGKPSVSEAVIHKVNGGELFEYGENGSRVPIEKKDSEDDAKPSPPPKDHFLSDEYLKEQGLRPASSSRNPGGMGY